MVLGRSQPLSRRNTILPARGGGVLGGLASPPALAISVNQQHLGQEKGLRSTPAKL